MTGFGSASRQIEKAVMPSDQGRNTESESNAVVPTESKTTSADLHTDTEGGLGLVPAELAGTQVDYGDSVGMSEHASQQYLPGNLALASPTSTQAEAGSPEAAESSMLDDEDVGDAVHGQIESNTITLSLGCEQDAIQIITHQSTCSVVMDSFQSNVRSEEPRLISDSVEEHISLADQQDAPTTDSKDGQNLDEPHTEMIDQPDKEVAIEQDQQDKLVAIEQDQQDEQIAIEQDQQVAAEYDKLIVDGQGEAAVDQEGNHIIDEQDTRDASEQDKSSFAEDNQIAQKQATQMAEVQGRQIADEQSSHIPGEEYGHADHEQDNLTRDGEEQKIAEGQRTQVGDPRDEQIVESRKRTSLLADHASPSQTEEGDAPMEMQEDQATTITVIEEMDVDFAISPEIEEGRKSEVEDLRVELSEKDNELKRLRDELFLASEALQREQLAIKTAEDILRQEHEANAAILSAKNKALEDLQAAFFSVESEATRLQSQVVQMQSDLRAMAMAAEQNEESASKDFDQLKAHKDRLEAELLKIQQADALRTQELLVRMEKLEQNNTTLDMQYKALKELFDYKETRGLLSRVLNL